MRPDLNQPSTAPARSLPNDHSQRKQSLRMTHEEMIAWQQSHVNDMWRVFRIMAEFVDGFETLSSVGPCVSVFGSSRTPEDDGYHRMGVEVGLTPVEWRCGASQG